MSSSSLLQVEMRHRVGGVTLDVEFTLTQSWTVLFGPSGCGKTTVLRAIAGFVRPEGRIMKDDVVLLDDRAGVFVPPHLRPVRSAMQTAWLLPDQTVAANLLYGSGGRSKPQDARQVAEEIAAIFGLGELVGRKPEGLSGGERQRVSVARTIVSAVTFAGPGEALLLLDEPFTGLDATLRDGLLRELKDWLTRWKVPVLSVTHDLGEAFRIGAEVIRMADGRVADQGRVERVLAVEKQQMLQRLGDGSFADGD
jgi:molybdate transport system ATP-binding protein